MSDCISDTHDPALMAHPSTLSSTTPSITISSSTVASQRPSSFDDLPFHSSRPAIGPMSIPHTKESPPPPLPPPRFIDDLSEGQDTGWQYANSGGAGQDSERQIKPGSSLLGGAGYLRSPRMQSDSSLDRISHHSSATPSSAAGEPSQGDSLDPSQSRPSPDRQTRDNSRLHGEKHLGQRSLENSSHAYDKHLLSRIGGPRTPPRSSGSDGGEPSQGSQGSLKNLNGQLKPLSMPERTHPSVDSPRSRWTSGGQSSPSLSNLRSPSFDPAMESAHPQPRRYNSSSTLPGREEQPASAASLSHRNSYDHSMFDQDYEDNGMKDLHLQEGRSDDAHSKSGMKRRANSPPPDNSMEAQITSAPNDPQYWPRRPPQPAGSQDGSSSRYPPNSGSYSSVNSSFNAKTASYPSSYGLSVPSSATSYGSERLSPITMQMANVSEPLDYSITKGHIASPRGPTVIPHLRSAADPRSHMGSRPGDATSASRSTGTPRMQHLYICECCPKKPRKFENAEELRIHEMEKQYICQYCNNRFKNKNEAERHQNSLHLRRHSWSCAALTTFEDAFHPHATAPSLCDICGYCGEEFANPPNWDVRVEHLNHEHKFGECNHAKKFFRADHFRQHLKHSHAGKSGKWTNMLENACMKDEPPPQPIHHQGLLPGLHQMAPMTAMSAINQMNMRGRIGEMREER